MIITTTGKYKIIPQTAINQIGNPYRIRRVQVTEIDLDGHKVYCRELGWIDWDLPIAGEKKVKAK